jgi:uncharacterized membrane protein
VTDTAAPPPLGTDARVPAAVAYLAWWVSGALVWLIERDRDEVRVHAAQAMIAFGAVSLAWATLWGGSFAVLVVSATGFFLLQRLAQLVLLAGFVVWAVCLWQVSRGLGFRLPWVGRLAERLTSRHSSPPARG